jgi:hypothetical protein
VAADFNAISAPGTAVLSGRTLAIWWTSSAPAGSRYQVYLNRRLAWWGMETRCELPLPPTRSEVAICAVPVGEERINYAASIPAGSGLCKRPRLTWKGGSYLGDVDAYRVYGEATPGGGLDYAVPLGEVPASPSGHDADGWGEGGWGEGGWGGSARSYSWLGSPLGPGTWAFAVKAVDRSGKESTAATTSVVIAGPPRPPEPASDGSRLRYTFNAGTRVASLSWLASPAS